MKTLFFYVLISLAGIVGYAQDYNPADAGSSVKFKIKNFGFNVDGSFKGLEGKIHFDPAHLPDARFDVSIDANTIDTDNHTRDGHLKKEDYFDVQNHPRIRFVSTGIKAGGKKGEFIFSGKLTIKDKTQELSFPFTASPMGNDYIFSGEFKINRKDFGVGGSSTISNSLTVALTVFARKV